MILGLVLGIIYVVSLILAFMFGYGLADQKYKSQDTDEE